MTNQIDYYSILIKKINISFMGTFSINLFVFLFHYHFNSERKLLSHNDNAVSFLITNFNHRWQRIHFFTCSISRLLICKVLLLKPSPPFIWTGSIIENHFNCRSSFYYYFNENPNHTEPNIFQNWFQINEEDHIFVW